MQVFAVLVVHTKQKLFCIIAELNTTNHTFERVR